MRAALFYSVLAALMMNSETLFGWDSMGTWLDLSSRVVALIIFASVFVSAGGIVSSLRPMMHHEGLFFQAALEILVRVPFAAQGTCVT